MLWYYDVTFYTFFVSQESGVTSFSELEGRRINTGGTGSILHLVTMDLLEDLGLSVSFYNAVKAEAGNAYVNRQIVGMPSAAAVPDGFLLQMNASLPIHVLSMTDEEIAAVMQGKPFYIKSIIPAGSPYNNTDPIQTIGYMQGGAASTALSQEDGYRIVSAMYSREAIEIWGPTMPSAADRDFVELMSNSPVPIHAGAIQYIESLGRLDEIPPHLIPAEYVPTTPR